MGSVLMHSERDGWTGEDVRGRAKSQRGVGGNEEGKGSLRAGYAPLDPTNIVSILVRRSFSLAPSFFYEIGRAHV